MTPATLDDLCPLLSIGSASIKDDRLSNPSLLGFWGPSVPQKIIPISILGLTRVIGPVDGRLNLDDCPSGTC
ncbi:hypothetical protein PtA15_8A259 [Puccinia triticina]|uniref:Uncharacterized protein n=1 Tax=Puccinia triticina TaxID=208348 RepID=A0ABY7CQP8_9BASI|nr:uncharacterized protein PtA15_8A259 [Puccinia triticina]WAQ87355.1 hypothetical protein PtA15_8A259 [Puccinia triticina]WAR57206.1 hypothetical protein PtB15_8B253 [Puccinia triticina]